MDNFILHDALDGTYLGAVATLEAAHLARFDCSSQYVRIVEVLKRDDAGNVIEERTVYQDAT